MVISIIGAGAVGGYLGSKLDDDVHIYEEHRKIGEPVQCSGLLTGNIRDLVKLDKGVVVNEIKRVRLNSPNGGKCEFELKRKDIVVDRAKLDRMLVGRAVDNGVKLHLGKKFDGGNIKGDVFIGADGPLQKQSVNRAFRKASREILPLKGNGKTSPNIIIGADGPFSVVNKGYFDNPKLRFWVGKQARVRMKNEGNVFEVFFDVPGFFGWIIPENEEIVRIGLASERNVETYFKKFLKSKNVKGVKDVQAGVIPRYNPKVRLWNGNNAFLVGDSGGMVKALSGGGVIPGMKAADILADILKGNKKYGNYEGRFRKEVGEGLGRSLKVREILEKFDDGDYDKLVYLLNKNKFKGFDRENFGVMDVLKVMKPELMMLGLKKFCFNEKLF